MVLLFLVLPALIVAGYALFQWARTRQPTSLESGVDAFRREMQALSPEARPPTRRPGAGRPDELEAEPGGRDRRAGPGPSDPRGPHRRPPSPGVG